MEAVMHWNDIWIDQQQKNIRSGRGGGCWTSWQDEPAARRYAERVKTRFANQQRVSELIEMVQPGWKVLDIGAGPGNIAIPLAVKAGSVTAVEPADGMVAVMRENLEGAERTNVEIVQKKWDDVDIQTDLTPFYDLTVASFSLGMVDLMAAIQKMNAVTSKQIVLYWHAGDQDWDFEARMFWPSIYKADYSPVPKSDIVFNLLYEMGIFPNVKSYCFEVVTRYESLNDALIDYYSRFDLKEGEQDFLIRSHVEKEYAMVDGGYQRSYRQHSMRFSWAPTNEAV